MPNEQRRFTVSYEFINTCHCTQGCHSTNQEKNTPVIPSDIRALSNLLMNSIRDKDVNQFNSILSQDFIYAGNGLKAGDTDQSDKFYYKSSGAGIAHNYDSSVDWNRTGMHEYSNYKKIYIGNNHTKKWRYEYYDTGSLVEVLFAEHNNLFLELLNQVAASDKQDLHRIFIQHCEKNNFFPKELLKPCDEDLRKKLKKGIDEIKKYGQKLTLSGITKGRDVSDLGISLEDQLNKMPQDQDSDSKKVKSLKFKFDFTKKIHYLDDRLTGHHGWKEIVMNFAISLGTAFIANIFNYAINRHVFFSCNTASQNLVGQVSKQFHTEKRVMNMKN